MVRSTAALDILLENQPWAWINPGPGSTLGLDLQVSLPSG